MSQWVVVYFAEGDYQFFLCWAEDFEHAEEQFENAYPDKRACWCEPDVTPDEALNNYMSIHVA